jgi:hypothetical protein
MSYRTLRLGAYMGSSQMGGPNGTQTAPLMWMRRQKGAVRKVLFAQTAPKRHPQCGRALSRKHARPGGRPQTKRGAPRQPASQQLLCCKECTILSNPTFSPVPNILARPDARALRP